MNKKLIWSIVIVVIILAIVAVATKSNPSSQSAADSTGPIKIGAVLSLSGVAAPWGEYAKNGINLAVKEINDGGGIDGRQVEVTIEDDNTDGAKSVSAWNKLVTVDGAQGIIGGVFDFTSQPLIPLALSHDVPYISPSNFRIAGGFDLNDQSFVMLTDMDKTVEKLQPYLASSSVKKLAIVHYKSTFGSEIAKTLTSTMNGLGRTAYDEPYAEIGNTDWKTVIIKLKSEGADGIFMDTVGSDPLNFLRQAKQLGYSPTFITYNGVQDAFAGQSDKSLLNGVVVLNWEVTTPGFASMYQDAYGIPPTKSADKYFEAVYVMAQALAHSSAPAQAAAYITANSFTTPNGTITFAADHSVNDVPVQVQVFKDAVEVPWK